MWKPSACDCECNKACKIDKYLCKTCLCKTHVLQGKKISQHENFPVSMLRS